MHSTLTAILEAPNDWYLNIDNGSLNGVPFLDLKKAFDTVDHNILLEKLELYGADTPLLSWFTSYLSNRKQRTCINSFFSSELLISCGVPQGCILGPPLFVINMNDLKACSLSSYARMYADDTCLTASAIDPEMLQFKLSHDLEILHSWLYANKVSLRRRTFY